MSQRRRAMQIVQRTALRVIIHNLQRSFVPIAPCILLLERKNAIIIPVVNLTLLFCAILMVPHNDRQR